MKLGQLCKKIGSGATPRGGKEVYLNQGPVSLIRSQNVHNNEFSFSGLAYINELQARELQNVEVEENDLLLNITGDSVARICQVDLNALPARVNQHVSIIRPHPEKLDHLFLKYWFLLPATQQLLLQLSSSGATRKALTKQMLESLDIPDILLNSQKMISNLLYRFDQKIELNRQMNEILEQMAQAVFQDWFVDFGPVKRKLEGINDPVAILGGLITDPAKAQEIASLFPDQFAEDGLPEGCSMGSISTYAELNPESWSAKKHPNVIQYVDLSNTKFGIIKHIQSYSWYKAPSRAKRILIKGDTVIGTVRPDNGAYSLIHTSGLTASTGFAVLRPKEYDFRSFIYCAITRADNIAHLAFLADGGAYPAVTPEQVLDTQVSILHRSILDCFNNIANNLFDLYAHNTDQNHTLAEMRDLLLPKLMSGEISVDELEKKMGGVL